MQWKPDYPLVLGGKTVHLAYQFHNLLFAALETEAFAADEPHSGLSCFSTYLAADRRSQNLPRAQLTSRLQSHKLLHSRSPVAIRQTL